MEQFGLGDWVSVGVGILLIGYGVRDILTGEKRRQAMTEAENVGEYKPGGGFDTKPDKKPSSASGYFSLILGVFLVGKNFI
jgi:hypothetical protein